MSIVETLHRAHMERLARLGGIPKPGKPEPVRIAAPVAPKPAEAPRPRRVWFSIVEELGGGPQKFPSVRDIQLACAKYYGVTHHDILSSRRTAKVVRPRQVGMYLAKTMTPRSYPDIGRRFGGRDHTTAIHAFRKIERLLETDGDLMEDVAAIIKGVRG